MTFTAVSSGQMVKSSITNENIRHAGRFNTDMTPMNNSGVNLADGSLDLGSVAYPWGNLFLMSGGKIYVGGVEFKGGSGGSGGIATAELKAQMERFGIDVPLSDPGAFSESYMRAGDVVITPRVSYSSGTTLVADVNKTDVDLCNATTGWTGGKTTGTSATVSQDTTNKIEGTGSVKLAVVSVSDQAWVYKDVTTFSLIDRTLNLSVYLYSKPAGLTSLDIKLGSTAAGSANYKTYRVTAANLSTGWNHLVIDPNNDTAQSTNGTWILGSTIHVAVLALFNTSTSVDFSVDFVVSADNFILVDATKTYKSFIFDGTHQEILKVNSVAGTGFHQRNTYTIADLSNAYAVGSAYAKQRNFTIQNGRGTFPAGLSGEVASTVYDISEYWLHDNLANQSLTLSSYWYDDPFKISSLPGTTETRIYSATDKHAYFKSGDKVILYHSRNNGFRNMSAYNSNANLLDNFKVVTLTSDATYSGIEIILTHSGESNAGTDASYWYVVRLSEQLQYLCEAMTDNGNFIDTTISEFTPGKGYNTLFSDTCVRADGAVGNDWNVSSYLYAGNGTAIGPTIATNRIKVQAGSANIYQSTARGIIDRNIENYIQNKLSAEIVVDFYHELASTNRTYDSIQIMYGTSGAYTNAGETSDVTPMVNNGFGIHWNTYSGTLSFMNGLTTIVTFATSAPALASWYKIKVRFLQGAIKVKIWLATDSEPSWIYESTSTSYVVTGNRLSIVLQSASIGGYYGTALYLQNIKIQSVDVGFTTRSKIDNLSGNRLYVVQKKSRRDTTNQNPETYYKCAYLEGLIAA